ncbi:MAG: hypothetical protein O7F71_21225 [Gammaproteobacteria bacterium]|nr:hypothetical protein [Gammaproteobacteria bacterium]
MGDSRRSRAFAAFVEETFPQTQRIADIAGGSGQLSFWLHELGKEPTIIDPRETRLPSWLRRKLRKRSLREGRLIQVKRLRRTVEEADLDNFDLLVAMHPDEATEPALRQALDNDMDFAIVPCCVFPMDGLKRSREEWPLYLASLAPGIETADLPIDGANTVLWRRREHA